MCLISIFLKVMASGGLYFYYLHQQFTVLNNNLCTFGRNSQRYWTHNTHYILWLDVSMVPHGDVSRRTSVKEGHCLERLRGEMPTVLHNTSIFARPGLSIKLKVSILCICSALNYKITAVVRQPQSTWSSVRPGYFIHQSCWCSGFILVQLVQKICSY